ncbi:MAG: 30S ribosomal protein S15 [Bacteroidales bacterium]|nr:30S ribosomal protein S15 [Bacteroidales bacterium]
MYLTTEKKHEIFAKFGKEEKNTGSSESQVALFTYRINYLNEHLKKNRKDFGTQRALLKLVGKRKRLLSYLRNTDIERYRILIRELGLRK